VKIRELLERKTPFYLYDMTVLGKNLGSLKKAADHYGYKVHYAVKSNARLEILRKVKDYGFGVDCVSGGELLQSLKAGYTGSEIVFAGVGKSDDELRLGLKHDIFCFNCESLQELEVLAEIARHESRSARIALRIKPNVDARTHHYITTGLEENKFGIDFTELPEAMRIIESNPELNFQGIHFHIGSQITDLSVFRNLCTKVNQVLEWFRERSIKIEHINLGGGLGVDYERPDSDEAKYEEFFGIFNDQLNLRAEQIHFELGRVITAHCGSLISKVLYTKSGIHTDFLILDAGMTELIRPALYQAYHKIENWSQSKAQSEYKYDVVGPICESSDYFGKAVRLPESKRGDLIAIRSAGAYGEVMASNYNLRERGEALFIN